MTHDETSERGREIPGTRTSDVESHRPAPPRIDGAQLIAILTRVAGLDRTPRRAGRQTPIGENGFWLDSVDLVEVVLACEEAFAVEFGSLAVHGEGPLTVARLLAAIRAAHRR